MNLKNSSSNTIYNHINFTNSNSLRLTFNKQVVLTNLDRMNKTLKKKRKSI